jgi:hypothetical protein
VVESHPPASHVEIARRFVAQKLQGYFSTFKGPLDYLAMNRADKTSTPPTKKITGPIPVIVVRAIIHPTPITDASIPEIQANLRLSRPRDPIIIEIGEPTRARRPNITVTPEAETVLLTTDKLTVPK